MGEKLTKYREETLAVAGSLYEVANQLCTTSKGLMKATIAGSAVTLLGGTLTTAGFILSFEKLDTSLLLTSVGAGTCGFGSLVTGGSALVEFMQQMKAKRTAARQIHIYDPTRRNIFNILKEFEEISKRLQPESIESHSPSRSSFDSMLGLLKVGWSVVRYVIDTVVKPKFHVWYAIVDAVTTFHELKEIAIASCATGVLGIAMIPLYNVFLKYYCNALSTDKWPDTSWQIRATADKLLKNCPDEYKINGMIETVQIMNTEM